MKKIIELKDLNISFYENIFYTISGSNNSGKTTLIRRLKDNYNFVQAVIPFELRVNKNTLLEELNYLKVDEDLINYLLKGLKIKAISKEFLTKLSKKEMILVQIAIALAKRPKVLLLDNIGNYLSTDEFKSVLKFLRNYQEKYSLILINTTIHLDEALLFDYLYIIDSLKIVLEWEHLEVLQNDNILNKLGLEVPLWLIYQ